MAYNLDSRVYVLKGAGSNDGYVWLLGLCLTQRKDGRNPSGQRELLGHSDTHPTSLMGAETPGAHCPFHELLMPWCLKVKDAHACVSAPCAHTHMCTHTPAQSSTASIQGHPVATPIFGKKRASNEINELITPLCSRQCHGQFKEPGRGPLSPLPGGPPKGERGPPVEARGCSLRALGLWPSALPEPRQRAFRLCCTVQIPRGVEAKRAHAAAADSCNTNRLSEASRVAAATAEAASARAAQGPASVPTLHAAKRLAFASAERQPRQPWNHKQRPASERLSLEWHLLGIPVFAVVDSTGSPFVFSEERAPRSRSRRTYWDRLRGRGPPLKSDPPRLVQKGLLFFDANEAFAYLHQLLKTSPHVDARVAVLSLSRVFPEFRRQSRLLLRLPPDDASHKAPILEQRQDHEALSPLFQWLFVPSRRATVHARQIRRALGVPLFYRRELRILRGGKSILPLFFDLEDLQRTWKAACAGNGGASSCSSSNEGDDKAGVEIVDFLDLLLRAALEPQSAACAQGDLSNGAVTPGQQHQQGKQPQQPHLLGKLLEEGLWGLVPSTVALEQVEALKKGGTRPAVLHTSPDD
ncbi:uncharacterized protein LOC113147510 [Cyclospora cayetanensis]|uniref:Uncharacterized protein LOC113147510 n=1 Tax=Cyclospora cayetanensis TaxID=88456 RepID=A0A6P6S1P0_9EIME|nr:uncharacterized protein LOC113147510 [Cyclospora cayetanensis]